MNVERLLGLFIFGLDLQAKLKAEQVADEEGFELIRRYLQQQTQKRLTRRFPSHLKLSCPSIFEDDENEVNYGKVQPRTRPNTLKLNLDVSGSANPSLDTFADFLDEKSINDFGHKLIPTFPNPAVF